jgi:hypothetical protein
MWRVALQVVRFRTLRYPEQFRDNHLSGVGGGLHRIQWTETKKESRRELLRLFRGQPSAPNFFLAAGSTNLGLMKMPINAGA